MQDTNSTYKKKSVIFLHTNSKLCEKEIKKTNPFKMALKIIGIHLTKEVKDLILENIKH